MNSHRTPNIHAVKRFLKAVEARFKDEHWSFDAYVGYFRAAHEFAAKEMVCTKTLYNYVDHVLMTLLERKTRYYKVIRLPDKTSQSVMNAFAALKSEYGERFPHIFKTITTDNGSEFSRLAEIELESETKVYYARPYSSCEKGSNERHNGLLHHFFPKGRRIDSFTDEDISDAENWINSMPGKLFQYKTPKMLFEKKFQFYNTPTSDEIPQRREPPALFAEEFRFYPIWLTSSTCSCNSGRRNPNPSPIGMMFGFLKYGGVLSTALEPKISPRVTVLASSVKLKLSTTQLFYLIV